MIPSTASHINFPVIKKAEGKYCWDVNGKKYLDFFGANLTVVLGHKQFKFDNPPHFSGKSYLEDEVSKQLSKYTKTKYFRYFKNGHNAVDCAIRLSRHLLGNKTSIKNLYPNTQPLICFAGYGGASSEYVWTTSNRNGIPWQATTQELIDADVLVYESRYEKYISHLKPKIKICDHLKSGINGLYENIDADFHLYGKSIANGYPVAVMTGKDKLMKRIDEIYYSTTFGGDNVGLEAIQKTIKQYDRSKWLDLKMYADSKLSPWGALNPWGSLNQMQIKKFIDNGVLYNGFWQIMTEHTKKDIDILESLCSRILL